MKRSLHTLLAAAAIILSAARLIVFAGAYDEDIWYEGDIFRGCGKGCVALTFDDGPHKTKTDEILDILEKYDVPATFFMIGQNAELYPDVAKRVAESGHEIGNHTYSHAYLKGASHDTLMMEIEMCEDILYTTVGKVPHILRPPGGLYDTDVIEAARRCGDIVVLWSVDTRDWDHEETSEIVDTVMENVRDGAIILMHDFVSGTSHTAEALEIIIPLLRSQGYRFVTVSDMYLNCR